MSARNPPTILVTGATDGIGQETARQLARRGALVVLHGRSSERLARARAALEREVGQRMPEPVTGDLASFVSVRAMAAALNARPQGLDVLLNNAGVFLRTRQVSAEGLELTMAVNHFGPFLLTHLLLAGRAGAGLARIVNVASVAHQRGAIRTTNGPKPGPEQAFDGYRAYADSKLANVLFTVELARRLGDRARVNALHPGVVSTKLLTEGFGMQGQDTLEDAAATSVFLALDKEGGELTGRYFSDQREATMSPAARDPALARDFYEESAKIVGVAPLEG